MDDRELLERAARAAGIVLEWDGPTDQWQPMYYEGKTYHFWNPLEDDGDAFRLMVALGIDVAYYTGFQEVEATPDVRDFDSVSIGFTDDRNKDTRRAIVRAAAAMENNE